MNEEKIMQVYDGYYGDLSKFDPELYRAKNEGERFDEAWVSPEGKWYNVKLGLHQSFAYRIFYLKNPPKPNEELKHLSLEEEANEWILGQGWIMIETDIGCGTILRGYQHMNKKQYKVLLTHFKDTKLFRGWTIRGLWLLKEEAKEQAKGDY